MLRRSSTGREGYERDLAYLRGRVRRLEASPDAGKKKLAAELADLVTQLERLQVDSSATDQEKTDDRCGANYSISAHVYPGMAYGSSDAAAGYVEFGPPSPWSKSLFTYAYASSWYTDDDSHYGTFSGAGTYAVQDAHAETGPAFDQDLFAFSSINGNGCAGGYDSATAEWPEQ